MAHGLQVVGDQESSRNTVNVRTRDNQRRGEHPLAKVLDVLREELSSRCTCLSHIPPQQASKGAA